MKEKLSLHKQRIIVAICVALMVINTQIQQTGAWDDFLVCSSYHVTEILLSIIILSHYSLQDLKSNSRVLLVYSIIGAAVGIGYLIYRLPNEYLFRIPSVLCMVFGLFMTGFCLVHTGLLYVCKKKDLYINKPGFIIWAILAFFMMISAGSYNLFAIRFMICLLAFYLTPRTSGQRTEVFVGALDGLIIGYVYEMEFCFLFRPYDSLRYLGNFSNPNHNCCFLCFILAAVFGRLFYAEKNKEKKIIRMILFSVMGMVLSCIYMTASRSGFITLLVIGILYLILYKSILHRNAVKRFFIVMLIFVVGLPITYAAIRYLPLTNPYVKFYYFDNHNFHTVHKENKTDPANYVTFGEMLSTPLMRFNVLIPSADENDDVADTAVLLPQNESCIVRDALSASAGTFVRSIDSSVVSVLLTDSGIGNTYDMEPLLTDEEGQNALLVRKTIYLWYIRHLTLRGVPTEEQGFQLNSEHWIQDTHDIFLAYGMDYGIPAMITFIVLLGYSVFYCFKNALRKSDVICAAAVLLILVAPLFGLFEYAWGYGSISMNLLYFSIGEAIVRNSSSEMKKSV